jgi:hypothetical protein
MTCTPSAARACQAIAVILVMLSPGMAWAQGTGTALTDIARRVQTPYSLWAEDPLTRRNRPRIAAWQQADDQDAEPSPLVEAAWLWTGLALVGGGAAMLISGHPPSNACSADGANATCVSWRPLGGALIGAGGLTLAIGAHARHARAVKVASRSVALVIRF